jgi:uncharacterized alpha-E superfamily protein
MDYGSADQIGVFFMLGRVADNIYWLSRNIERASNTARFVEASCYLNLDFQIDNREQWTPLIEINEDMDAFSAYYDEPSRDHVLHWLIYNEESPNSIRSCLHRARMIASTLREVLSIEVFQQISNVSQLIPEVTHHAVPPHHVIFSLCEQIKKADMLITGIMSKNMERGIGYNFWRLGEYLERADKTSRLLNVNYFYLLPDVVDVGTSVEDVQWSALLQSIDAREAYYRRYSIIDAEHVIEMIIHDSRFPRAIFFCLSSAKRCVLEITGTTISQPYLELDQLCSELVEVKSADIIETGLHEFIDKLQIKMNAINLSIYTSFCDVRTSSFT